MSIKVTVAVENTVAFPFAPRIKPGLFGEHGLALVVEVNGKKWLYDTGRGKALLPNLVALGMVPDDFEGIILSHAHLDHFGSLMDFLRERTTPINVYMHPGAFVKRYTRVGDVYRQVGMPWGIEDLEGAGAQLHLNDTPVQVAQELWLTGSVVRHTSFEKVEEKFFIEDDSGNKIHDDIVDDQSLIIESDRGLYVLTGCAHAGVCNILDAVKEMFPEQKLRGVLGGLHLAGATRQRLLVTKEYLQKQNMDLIAVGHCTGFEACCVLAEGLSGTFVPLTVGMVLPLDGAE